MRGPRRRSPSNVASLVLAGVAVLALTAVAPAAHATTFTVNSTADTDDGTCSSAVPGGCTLSEAIAAAVATPGRDTIAFDPTVFPPGMPGVIALFQATPVIADPAGTVLDGSGAGVVIEAANQIGPSADPLVFASGPGVPLGAVAVADVAVRNFAGTGIVICGGEYPSCDQDVSKPTVQNVVATGNGVSGIRIAGRNVVRPRLIDDVVADNAGSGIDVEASQALTAARVQRCTARDNGAGIFGKPGIILHAGVAATGAVVVDSTAVHNGGLGIAVQSDQQTAKTKLTNVTVVRNQGFGLVVSSTGDVSATTIASTVASNGMSGGIIVDAGGTLAATTLKDVVANGNGGRGIGIGASFHLVGTKIVNTTATRNGGGGISVFSGVDATGARITRSAFVANAGIGLQLMGTRNSVKSVRADGNGAGIQLDAPGGGNRIEKCTAHANNGPAGGFGIAVAAGSTGNVIQKNAAFVNDGFDLSDGNPDCDGNTWKQNAFTGTSVACIQ